MLGLQLPQLSKYGAIYLEDSELNDMYLSNITDLSRVFFHNTSIKKLYLNDAIKKETINLSELYNCEEIYPDFLDELNINKSNISS